MKISNRSLYLTEEGFMTYPEFVTQIQVLINERQKQNENLYSARADTVRKIQGSYYGLVISMISEPTVELGIDLNKFFTGFITHRLSIEDIVNKVDQQLQHEIERISLYDIRSLTNYGYVKSHLGLQVINMEENRELLKEIPYTQIADLALVYRVFEDKNTCALINNKMLKSYGISREQLHSDAMLHVQREKPCYIREMREVMKDIIETNLLEADIPEEEKKEMQKMLDGIENELPIQLYVARIDGVYGASVIARPDFFEEATRIMGGDFYVIPSSMHEVIILKDLHRGDIRELEETIWEVNTLKVAKEDFLSNNLYHYDSNNQIFETATDYEQRMKNDPKMSM